MVLATSVVANPQLDPSNPTGFFTNVAMAMFQQMGLHDFNGNLVTVTNIPIYEDPTLYGGTNINYYTPAVHRILQLAANIFDATTNRFIDGGPTNYPTVFRPVFRSLNGVASIVGYEEVTNSAPVFLPFLDVTNFVLLNQPFNDLINMYGVPWVIGAKKGFPNFNEFSMNNPLSVTRTIEFTNSVPQPPWQTNQLINFSITNAFGVEVWNSYTNGYYRPLLLIASNELSIQVSNELGINFVDVENLPFGTETNLPSWPAWNDNPAFPDTSFQVPLLVATNYVNGIYLNQPPWVIPLAPPQWSATVVPHFYMALTFKFRFVLIDTSVTPNRVVDFVNLVDTEPPVDLDYVLSSGVSGLMDQTREADIWETNLLNGVSEGVLNQIDVGEGIPSGYHDWTDPTRSPETENLFRARLAGQAPAGFQTNNFSDPYIAQAVVWQLRSWQANDPLVHYTAQDMTSTNGQGAAYNGILVQYTSDPTPKGASLPNLGKLNFAYQPWGGNPLNPNNPQFDKNYQVKDPLIFQSDNWNFPTGEPLTFDWLGQVHRGTPWQTVFLKPSNQTLAQWLTWNNDNILITNGNFISLDTAFTYPTNDWRIAGLWAQWVSTNDLSTLLSINNTDTNAWTARLDGLTALTNSAPGELDPITISSNSPQAGIIAQAIQTARANTIITNGPVFPNQAFQQVGDVLATAQLSVGSPFLNTNGLNSSLANGITDEALEIIPTQLLPLLRFDSFGQITQSNGQLELSFSGYDGHTYAIQASSNLTDWAIISTNCPSGGNFEITNTATSGQEFYRSVLLQ